MHAEVNVRFEKRSTSDCEVWKIDSEATVVSFRFILFAATSNQYGLKRNSLMRVTYLVSLATPIIKM